MQIPWNQKAYAGVLLKAVGGRRWPDVGCGRRALPEDLAALEARAYNSAKVYAGVDVDRASLRANLAKMKVRAEADSLPFREAEFDIVTANMVMEHVANPGGVLDEVARVLNSGGVFLVPTPSARQYEILAARMLRLLLGGTIYTRMVAASEGSQRTFSPPGIDLTPPAPSGISPKPALKSACSSTMPKLLRSSCAGGTWLSLNLF